MERKNKKADDSKKPKVNALRPSMRDKKRYIAFEILSDRPLGYDADKKLICKINELLGVFQASKAGILRVKYDAKTQSGLFKVDRSFVDYARAAFVMIKSLDGVKVAVHTLRVSGMLNKAASELERKTANV
jgi:ribonuclease P/MRP protein subunit POP5